MGSCGGYNYVARTVEGEEDMYYIVVLEEECKTVLYMM